MSFVETDFEKPTRHNPYLHQIVIGEMKRLQKGSVLDIPSGPGYLIQDLNLLGFSGVAAEINEGLHCLKGVDYKAVDMTRKFPFEDASFDYVVSVEGIEHIENHFEFIRETRRVMKNGGKLFLTTPNINSLASRFYYFLTGFHTMAPMPTPLNTENVFFEHINPLSLEQLYFALSRSGFEVEKLMTHRERKGSKILYYLLYPFIRYGSWYSCFKKEKNLKRREMNKKIYSFIKSRENLLGSHTILQARAI